MIYFYLVPLFLSNKLKEQTEDATFFNRFLEAPGPDVGRWYCLPTIDTVCCIAANESKDILILQSVEIRGINCGENAAFIRKSDTCN